jgi:hypothetical protein
MDKPRVEPGQQSGKPYASGSSHAYGTRMFYSSFQKDPFTFTDNGFYTFMFPWKSENGVQTGLGSGYSFWMNRYEIAAGTQPFGFTMQDLGTGNWLWQPITHDGAYNAVDMSQDEWDSGLICRSPARTQTVWDNYYAVGSNALTLTTGVQFPDPDQATYGTLDTLNLRWDFPANHFMYIHAIGVQRNIS